MNYHIKTQKWEHILCFLQRASGIHANDDNKLRCFIEGVWPILRTGCQWRLLPSYYGHWRSPHKIFKQWSDRCVWQKLFSSVQNNPELEHLMIDAPIVRAHACSAGLEKKHEHPRSLGAQQGRFYNENACSCRWTRKSS